MPGREVSTTVQYRETIVWFGFESEVTLSLRVSSSPSLPMAQHHTTLEVHKNGNSAEMFVIISFGLAFLPGGGEDVRGTSRNSFHVKRVEEETWLVGSFCLHILHSEERLHV